jgi:PRC-barrel domain
MSESSAYEHRVGTKVVDTRGNTVGKVADVLYDDRTLEPRWVAVDLGLLHRHRPLVPLDETYLSDDGHLVVGFSASTVKHAPGVQGSTPTRTEAEELARYYGLPENN